MSRYIDADKLRKDEIARCHCVPCVGSNDNNWKDLDEVLNDAPTADAVEVIRCENCEKWDRENIEMHTRSSVDNTLNPFAECLHWSDWAVCRKTRFDDYCSCAERREENEAYRC